jgi:hypothetical protein
MRTESEMYEAAQRRDTLWTDFKRAFTASRSPASQVREIRALDRVMREIRRQDAEIRRLEAHFAARAAAMNTRGGRT